MRFERTKNSARNVVFGVVSKIVAVIFPFITRTLILQKLGSAYAGLGGLFTSILAVLSVTELGFGSAVVFCMYRPVAEGKTDEICQLLSLIKKIYKVIGFFILAVGVVLTPFLGYFIKADCPVDINLTYLYFIYLLNSASSYLMFSYKEVVFNAYQRKDVIYKIQTIAEIFKYALQIIILCLFPNYYYFTLALLISTVLNSALIGYYSLKLFPKLKPFGKPDREYTKVIKNKVKYLAANVISSKIVNATDNIIISAGIGLTMVTVYGNYQYITTSVAAFILIAFSSLTSSIGNTIVSESEEKNYRVYSTLWSASSWMIIWSSICMLCLFQPFILLWVGNEYLLELPVVVMFVLLFFSNMCTQFFSTVYVHAAGLWNKTVAFRIIASLVNLALDVVLVKQFGVGGIIFASLAAYLFISLPLHIYVTYKYILKISPIVGYRSLVKAVISLILYGAMTYAVCELFSGVGIMPFVCKCVICCVMPNIAYFLINRRTTEFQETVGYVKMIIKR